MLKSFDTEYGRIAPFICSDMAFLSKIQQAGRNNVDILIVPASDWKEMTLLAAKTAIVRGVENGSNIIRHTNNGMSIVSDFRGSVLAQTDYFQSDTKTLSAQVAMKGRFTLYSYIGNIFVYLCSIYLLGSLIIPKIKRLLQITYSDEKIAIQAYQFKEQLNSRLKSMLCEIGWVISGKRTLYLSGWYWRIEQRKGAKRATIALARKLLTLIYTMLKTKEPYNEDCFEQRRKSCERKRAHRMVNELQKLGYMVVPPS